MKYLIYLTLLTTFFSFIPVKSNPPDPNKKYHVTLDLTLNDANSLINGLSQSDVVAARLSTYAAQSISYQINSQINQESETERKADSLKANTSPNKGK